MICERCGDPIEPGEAYETVDIPRPTGAGVTVLLHKKPCVKALFQSAPAGDHRRT